MTYAIKVEDAPVRKGKSAEAMEAEEERIRR